MILKAAIVHILDSSVGIPVLSDQSMEVGPDFSDFLKAHIEKITESDDVKHCTFAEGSEVKELLQNCTPDNFVETSKQLAERLYDIMTELEYRSGMERCNIMQGLVEAVQPPMWR